MSPGDLGSGACAAGIVLPGPRSPLRAELLPESQPELLPRPPCALQPFTEISRGVWGALPLLVNLGTGGSTAPPGILPELPVSAFLSGKIGKVPASLGLGFPVLEVLATWP